jgi:hypothetical protein
MGSGSLLAKDRDSFSGVVTYRQQATGRERGKRPASIGTFATFYSGWRFKKTEI